MRKPTFLTLPSARPFRLTCLCAALILSGVAVAPSTPAMAAPDATASSAADLCAQVGNRAGFPRSRLVTAVAIGLAESRCNPAAVGRNGPTRGCPRGSTDRGLWQINDCHHPTVSKRCAHDPQCNAAAAHRISSGGTNFRPWVTYNTGRYRAYLPAARAAVRRLGAS
jgi:hypothetical protein